jgi:hypothetical protein
MAPLVLSIFGAIKVGFSGTSESSCYVRVGQTLRERGDELDDAVVAFYMMPGTKTVVHAAIETEDGVLIDERHAPPHFRDSDGRQIRNDVTRSVLVVSAVLGWLRSQQEQAPQLNT